MGLIRTVRTWWVLRLFRRQLRYFTKRLDPTNPRDQAVLSCIRDTIARIESGEIDVTSATG